VSRGQLRRVENRLIVLSHPFRGNCQFCQWARGWNRRSIKHARIESRDGTNDRALQAASYNAAAMNADVLTYSRSKGLSAGVSLEGASMESDNDGNKAVYGKDISAEDFVTGGLAVAPAATSLVNLLDMTSRARK
jgi:hypothetical protein